MKRLGINLAMALTLCCAVALAATVEAKDRSKTINFTENVLVNNTMIEKGAYRIKFDADTNQVAVMKGGQVVATAKAEVRMTDKKAPYNSVSFSSSERGKILTGITFEGDKRLILIGEPSEAGK